MFITVPTRTSSCVEALKVDLLARKVLVTFKTSGTYLYKNVSARAIALVLFNPQISWGFFVNQSCVNSSRTTWEYAPELMSPQLPSFV